MSAALPDRFKPEVRLGRDRSSELWLATDMSLDRPVLARVIGPNAGPRRRAEFLAGVRAVAAVTHDHLAAVYAAEDTGESAYAVTEWAGGVTIADRISAGEPIDLDDFLPNAAGLADALAKLHAADIVHGAIAPDAVLYSAAHPAKLSPFARLDGTPRTDTADLARTLVAGLAGGPTELPPSQLAEGLSRSVDTAIRGAKSGRLDAAGLAAALRAAPSPSSPGRVPRWRWRWMRVGAALFGVALIVIMLGFALEADTDSALLFPVGEPTPLPTTSPTSAPPDAAETPPEDGPLRPIVIEGARAFDPFGDGSERDGDIANTHDGSLSSSWRTERYFDPLQLIKPGVGVAFDVAGSVSSIRIDGSAGTAVTVAWSPDVAAPFDDWAQLASGVIGAEATSLEVPTRTDGWWLLWLTDLPPQDNGEFYYASIAEVRFLP